MNKLPTYGATPMKKLLKPAMIALAASAASALPSCTEEKVEPLFAPTLESM